VGEIKGQWIEEERKEEILLMVEQAKKQGLSASRICFMWRINRRRIVRWSNKWNREKNLRNAKPGPKHPAHKLLPEECSAVLEMAKKKKYVDLAHRTLTVKAWDQGLFFLSFTSVYRIMRSAGIMSMRGDHGPHNGRSMPPERKELTGPNQRWCWDISYLKTFEKGIHLYLYLLLDEYSRKAIQWRVSWYQNAHEARGFIEEGLISENILDLPEDRRPVIINDRGSQMKAKSIQKIFESHHMPQLFARPRTPNDNPYVESLFGKIKTAPKYPERFLDLSQATEYFERHFSWYNTEHLHSRIDFVTPNQCHQGLREKIVAKRKSKLEKNRQYRKEVNRLNQATLQKKINHFVALNQFSSCSVINS
jgi:putative transposase